MFVALIVSMVLWTNPTPTIWICNPGKTPMPDPRSNCERLPVHVLYKMWFPELKGLK